MTKNITPGIPRSQGITRIKGKALSFYSPKYQRWITRSWPKGQGADTVNRALNRQTFSRTVKMIKSVDASEYQDATDLSKGTPYLFRDLLMKAAQGTLVSFTDTDGRFWMPTRDAIQTIQPMLDSISAVPGAMLYRNSSFWDYVAPPASDSVLVFTTSPRSIDWLDANDFIQASLDAISPDTGSILYRNATEWVALPKGAAGQVLGMDAGADFPEWQTPVVGSSDMILVGHAIAAGGNTTPSLSVGAIPATGKHLIIKTLLRTATAPGTVNCGVTFNGDNGANYDYYEENRFGNAPATNANFLRSISANPSSETAGRFAAGQVEVIDYAQFAIQRGTLYRCMLSQGGTMFHDQGGGWWHNTTAAITSVTVTPISGALLMDGSICSVYLTK